MPSRTPEIPILISILALCWQGKTKIWNAGLYDDTIRNLVGTLAAEFLPAYESSRYQQGNCQFEFRDEMNAMIYGNLRNREMDVALNSSDLRKDGVSGRLENIHEKDPFH